MTDTSTEAVETLTAFLKGAGPLDGRWFGEKHKPAFWWRKYLGSIKALAAQRDALSACVTELEAERDILQSQLATTTKQRDYNTEVIDQRNTMLATARNDTLDEVVHMFIEEAEHDESGLQYSDDVGIPLSNANELEVSSRRARENAKMVLAVKTKQEGE